MFLVKGYKKFVRINFSTKNNFVQSNKVKFRFPIILYPSRPIIRRLLSYRSKILTLNFE